MRNSPFPAAARASSAIPFVAFAPAVLLLILLLSVAAPAASASEFASAAPELIPEAPNEGVSSAVVVSGATTNITSLAVTLDITHTFTADLDVLLLPPGVTWPLALTVTAGNEADAILAGAIPLARDAGANGNDYTATILTAAGDMEFDAQSRAPGIAAGVAPFTGVFVAEGNLASLYGTDANGTWTLVVIDDFVVDNGTLEQWRLTLNDDPEVAVFEGAVPITGGGTHSGRALVRGVPETRTYTVHNLSALSPLALNAPLSVSVSNDVNCSAVVTQQPLVAVVPVSSTTTFNVEVTAFTTGPYSFEVSVTSNDPFEPSFDFTVSGNAGWCKVLLLAATGRDQDLADVAGYLDALGRDFAIDWLNAAIETPTLAELQAYAVVVVWSIADFANADVLGDRLKNFVDGGGHVVVCAAANAAPGNLEIGGTWKAAAYNPITPGSLPGAPQSLGTVHDPSHAILNGVTNLATTGVQVSGATANPLATAVADWDNGDAAIVVRDDLNGNVVGLNFHPPKTGANAGWAPLLGAFDSLLGNAIDFAKGPTMELTRTGNVVTNGGQDPLGELGLNVPAPFIYTIRNPGCSNLELTGAPIVRAYNQTNCTVTLTQAPAAALIPGGVTTFTLEVTPLAPTFTFDVSIDNNDRDRNPYMFNVDGTAIALGPEIDVQRPAGQSLGDGATPAADALGTLPGGQPVSFTYTIANEGSAALTLTGTPSVAVVGEIDCTVTVTTQPASTSIAALASETFTIVVTPTAGAGTFSFDLVTPSDDVSEPTHTVAVTGDRADVPYIVAPEEALWGEVVESNTLINPVTLTNIGTTPLSITDVVLVDPDGYWTLDSTTPAASPTALPFHDLVTPITVVASGTLVLNIAFTPGVVATDLTARLVITCDSEGAAGTIITIWLRGDGVLDVIVSGCRVGSGSAATQRGTGLLALALLLPLFALMALTRGTRRRVKLSESASPKITTMSTRRLPSIPMPILLLVIALALGLCCDAALAQEASSPNYRVVAGGVNGGAGLSTSASFSAELAVPPNGGEIGSPLYAERTGVPFGLEHQGGLVQILSVSQHQIAQGAVATIQWQALAAGEYQVEIGGQGVLSAGIIIEMGTVAANTPTQSDVPAEFLTQGTNFLYFFLKLTPVSLAATFLERLDAGPVIPPGGTPAPPPPSCGAVPAAQGFSARSRDAGLVLLFAMLGMFVLSLRRRVRARAAFVRGTAAASASHSSPVPDRAPGVATLTAS